MLRIFVVALLLFGISQAEPLKPTEYKNLNIESCAILKGKATVEARQYLERQGVSPDSAICTIVAMMKLSLDPHEEDVPLLAQRLDWVIPIDRSVAGSLLDGDDESIPAIASLSRYGRIALPGMYAAAASTRASPRARRSSVLVIQKILIEVMPTSCSGPITEVTEAALHAVAKRDTLANDLTEVQRTCVDGGGGK